MTASDKTIGVRIRELRGAMTQKDLAEAVDMDPTILNKIESGSRRISLYEAIEIAEELGVSTDTLLRADEPMFVMRAEDGTDVAETQAVCRELAETYLHLQALVGK